MRDTGKAIMTALRENLARVGVQHQIVGDPVLFDVIFTERPVNDYRDVLAGDAETLTAFNRTLRERGILKSEGKFYVSLAHDAADVAHTIEAIVTRPRTGSRRYDDSI